MSRSVRTPRQRSSFSSSNSLGKLLLILRYSVFRQFDDDCDDKTFNKNNNEHLYSSQVHSLLISFQKKICNKMLVIHKICYLVTNYSCLR